MAINQFSQPHFHDEEAARQWFEKARWPEGPVCPHCNSAKHYATKKSGRYRCAATTCRKDFTVMTGSVMERSHAKLTQWAAAFHLAASSKKGFSAHQLHRELGCQYNTAWFLHHRVMEAMRRGGLDLPPMGGEGSTVEADETFIGRKEGSVKRRGHGHKNAVLSLVERGKQVRSFHIDGTSAADVMPIIRRNISKETAMMTDEGGHYSRLGSDFASHETVNHKADEYVRYDGETMISTNTVEGYFSIFKRGMRGVYQHCSEKHLHRYLAEFDFRYNYRQSLGFNDTDRTIEAVRGAEGKRLTYHQPHKA